MGNLVWDALQWARRLADTVHLRGRMAGSEKAGRPVSREFLRHWQAMPDDAEEGAE